MQRRSFLQFGAAAGIYALSGGFNRLEADTTDDGYKAIVVLYQAGGNDSLNMFVPSSDDAKKGYANYASIRNNIRVSDTVLTLPKGADGTLDLSSGNPYAENNSLIDAYTKGFYKHQNLPYATNALMPELADLVDRGKVAIVANAGNLIAPATKAEFDAKTKQLPPFLFAHNHQSKLALNGEAAILDYSGWGGRIYDRWKGVNGGDIYGMNISIGRVTHLFDGDQTSPLIINAGGPSQYKNLNQTLYQNYMALSRRDIFKALYNNMRQHSFDMQDTIVNDWNNNTPDFSNLKNSYGDALFSKPTNDQLSQSSPTYADTGMLKQLEAVAKLAYIGKNRGLKRQIFYVEDGGYDTHNNQSQQHSRKLRGLSLALGDFYKALESMGMEKEVTTISLSEFGRSTGNNGDGTDHAWGSSYFVLGGAVKGGVYGTLPDLTLGSDDDLTKKGRLIPTTSFTQYFATVGKWFGLDAGGLDAIYPELGNFAVKDLGFMG